MFLLATHSLDMPDLGSKAIAALAVTFAVVLPLSSARYSALTYTLPARRQECFYEYVEVGTKMIVSYHVSLKRL